MQKPLWTDSLRRKKIIRNNWAIPTTTRRSLSSSASPGRSRSLVLSLHDINHEIRITAVNMNVTVEISMRKCFYSVKEDKRGFIELGNQLTFLVVMKSTSLFFPLALPGDDFQWPSTKPYFLIFSLTNLWYKKAAPLNWGRTNHATNTSFSSYQNGILQEGEIQPRIIIDLNWNDCQCSIFFFFCFSWDHTILRQVGGASPWEWGTSIWSSKQATAHHLPLLSSLWLLRTHTYSKIKPYNN